MPRVKLNLPRQFVKREAVEGKCERIKLTRASTDSSNFLIDGKSGIARIFRSGDGTSDYEIVRAGASRLRRSGNARLVLRRGITRPHPRNHNQEFRSAGAADGSRFPGRAYDSVEPRLFRQARQGNYARRHRTQYSHTPQRLRVQTCKQSNAEQRRRILFACKSFARRAHHGQSSGCMDVHHAHTGKFCGSRHCAGNRIRNVVILQVEENIGTKTRQLSNSLRALGGKELFANLEKADHAAELPRQSASQPQAVNIQGNDYS
jgi:hypothetical protein